MFERYLHEKFHHIAAYIDQVKGEWNLTIREQIRKEMGLTMSDEYHRHYVPIKVTSGFAVNSDDPFHGIPPDLFEYLLHRKEILETFPGLEFVREHYLSLSEFNLSLPVPNIQSIDIVYYSLAEILEKIDEIDLVSKILAKNEDTLGTYFPEKPEIVLYWMPILVISSALNVPIRELSLVVLIHELVHAYSHLGLDIDGGIWQTRDFISTSPMLLESTAQYFTQQVCRNLSRNSLTLTDAFSTILEHQPLMYTIFQTWEISSGDVKSENVRYAMLTCRANSIRDYGEFLRILEMTDIKKINLDNHQPSIFS